MPRMIGEADERPHEQGSEETWSESYYFAWFSPERSGITRIANRPNEGTQDVLVVVYDADGSITLARHKREEEENTDTLDVGGVQYRCEEPMKRWRITASADGLRLPSPRGSSSTSSSRPSSRLRRPRRTVRRSCSSSCARSRRATSSSPGR